MQLLINQYSVCKFGARGKPEMATQLKYPPKSLGWWVSCESWRVSCEKGTPYITNESFKPYANHLERKTTGQAQVEWAPTLSLTWSEWVTTKKHQQWGKKSGFLAKQQKWPKMQWELFWVNFSHHKHMPGHYWHQLPQAWCLGDAGMRMDATQQKNMGSSTPK